MFDYDDFFDDSLKYRPGYKYMLSRHPDCRDPDHPGCEACYVSEEEGEEDDA